MKYLQLLFVTLLSVSIVQAQPAKSDSLNVGSNLIASAQKMAQFFIEKNYPEYLQFVHPKIVKLVGGNDKMIEVVSKSIKQIEDQGFSLKSLTIGSPSGIISTSNELQSIIPQTLELKNQTGKLITTTYLLGLSNDNGKTWFFIDTGGKSIEQLKKVFPSLSNELIMPPKKEGIFIKD